MRLPRVRIGVGRMLFVTALAGLNCGLARQYSLVEASNRLRYFVLDWAEPLEIALGLSLLGNVVLVGLLLPIAGRLGSFWRGRGADVRRSPSAFTYFAAHLLALCALAGAFMPAAFSAYGESIQPYLYDLGRPLETILSKQRADDCCYFLERVVLAASLSGPLLFFSWIGGLMARRYASKVAAPRFGAMALLVSSGFAVAAMAIALTPRPFSENRNVDVDFQVVEEGTGEPIGAACIFIRNVFDSSELAEARGLTGRDGRARLSPGVYASGDRNAFRAMGAFSTWGKWLEISALGHRPIRVPLADFLGPEVDLERHCTFRVALAPGQAPENQFWDVAGKYCFHYRIEPDGRFSYEHIAMCSMDRTVREYGYVKRVDGDLVLTSVAYMDIGPNPDVAKRFCVIPWGPRHYLCAMDDHSIRGFCRAALHLANPEDAMYFGELLEADSDKPLAGMPRVPPMVWVRYARSECNVFDEQSGLRTALRAISPWKL